MIASLNEHEKCLIIAALYTVSPTGGGSDTFHLASRLASLWGVDMGSEAFGILMGRMSNVVVDEYFECVLSQDRIRYEDSLKQGI